MNSDIKKISRDSIIYAIGNSLSGLSGIILIVLYTKYLKPDEYGNYSLIIASYELILSIALGWIWRSTLRFKDSYSDMEGQKQFYSTVFLLLVSTVILVSSAAFITLNMLKDSFAEEVYFLCLLSILIILPESIYHIVNSILRSGRRVIEFNLNEVGIAIIRTAGAIVFIGILGLGAKGVLFSLITAYSIIAAINIKKMNIFKYLHLSNFSRRLFVELLDYGVPIAGISITSWILSSSDRYIIRYFFTAYEVGVYSVNYIFGSSIIMLINRFIMMGAFPLIIKTWNKDGKVLTEKLISTLLRYYFLIIVPAFFGFLAVAEPLLRILTTNRYADGFAVMTIISLGTIFLGISEYTNKAWELTKRTRNVLYLNLLAAISNIVLNLIFIPLFGPVAAAVTTTASYCIYLTASLAVSRKVLRIQINYRSLINVLMASAIMCTLVALIRLLIDGSILTILLMVISGVIVYFFGLLSLGEIRDETAQIVQRIKLIHIQSDISISENQNHFGGEYTMQAKINGPLISVIIPTHNRPDMLRRAIHSVLKQTYSNCEIIVVDDNSDCDNISIINSFKSNKIRYFRNNENLGGARTRNIGIKNAEGQYIAFLDDDDEFLPDKLYQQMQKLVTSEYKNLAFVYSKHICIDSLGSVIRRSGVKVSGNALKEHIITPITCTSCILIKRDVLLKVKGFRDLPSGQEYDLILRILAEGYETDYVDEFLVLYHVHDGERISSSDRVIKGKEMVFEIRNKYFYMLTRNEVRQVCHKHYISLFRCVLIKNGRIQAISYLLIALKYNMLCMDNVKEIIVLLLGHSCCTKIRNAVKSLKITLSVKLDNIK